MRKSSKWFKFTSIGLVLLGVVALFTWQSIDKNKEVQQIEKKLGFAVAVVDKQSHDAWWSASRTYVVKRLEEKESNIEYIFYLNNKNKIEQWAKIENGEVIKPIIKETE